MDQAMKDPGQALLKIVLVDDHSLCRNGLTDLLQQRGNMQVCAATGDPAKPYAAVFGAAALGLLMYGLVVLIDLILMRNRPQEAE